MPDRDTLLQALKTVRYPGFSRDIVSFGLVKDLGVTGGAVAVQLVLTSSNPDVVTALRADCDRVLRAVPGVTGVSLDIRLPAPSGSPPVGGAPGAFAQQARVPGLHRIIAVASGKGGVGKSTCSVNLACALARQGARVGLLDCDIYGPSIPLMMGVRERPGVSDDDKLLPPSNHGVKLMSMGFLLDGDQPVIWRGPMIVKTIQQFIHQVAWGDLDFLLVDLPPGTGDAQLTLCQTVPLDGGVIVTTPQEASLGVVRKGIAMFEKVNVPMIGLIENMSYYPAPDGTRVPIFGHGGGRAEAARQNIPFLGEIPLYQEIREGGDAGQPVVVTHPESPAAQVFLEMAGALRRRFARNGG